MDSEFRDPEWPGPELSENKFYFTRERLFILKRNKILSSDRFEPVTFQIVLVFWFLIESFDVRENRLKDPGLNSIIPFYLLYK